jgi:hypothetical protein
MKEDLIKKKNDKLLNESKLTKVKTTKAVHVTSCDFNEQIGLLAIALIDREIKIYHVK